MLSRMTTAKDMRHIVRKLKNCQDPSPVDESEELEEALQAQI
ncbi:hypothetical protein DsansV1_C36g0231851 [Dioscorea sansibarensis]